MGYDVDEEYPFDEDADGMRLLPKGMKKVGELYVLPNGKYLPRGCYRTEDGGHLIYEPRQLDPFADMLASFRD